MIASPRKCVHTVANDIPVCYITIPPLVTDMRHPKIIDHQIIETAPLSRRDLNRTNTQLTVGTITTISHARKPIISRRIVEIHLIENLDPNTSNILDLPTRTGLFKPRVSVMIVNRPLFGAIQA